MVAQIQAVVEEVPDRIKYMVIAIHYLLEVEVVQVLSSLKYPHHKIKLQHIQVQVHSLHSHRQ